MLKLVKELCMLDGVSSFEDEVREFALRRAEKAGCTCRVDTMGNLIAFKRGKKPTGSKLMLAAHMDEVGFIVESVAEDGVLKFQTVGGIDPRILPGKRVRVGKKKVPGVIAQKAIAQAGPEEQKNVTKAEDLYIDIGCRSREEAEALVSVGDCAAFDSDCVEFGAGMLKAKALDDRVGCAVMLKLMEEDLPMDCTFVFTVQEEVGLRGAFGAAFSVTPEIALVLEGTTAADLPGSPPHKRVTAPGKGPVISFMDGGTAYDRGLFELLRDTADQNRIPWQTKNYTSGGTDAAAIQRTKDGVRVAVMAASVRYLHAPSSVVCIRDLDNMHTLAGKFMEALAASV